MNHGLQHFTAHFAKLVIETPKLGPSPDCQVVDTPLIRHELVLVPATLSGTLHHFVPNLWSLRRSIVPQRMTFILYK